MLKLSRPLAFLDSETTGLDPQKDRIITLALEVHTPEGDVFPMDWKFNPGKLISPENAAIHGITNEMVKDWPPFERKAKCIFDWLDKCDFAGFNTTFDLSILSEELNRCNLVLDTQSKQILDVGMIYKKKMPRRLEDAVKQYCGKEHAGAHGAMADTVATREVFESMMDLYEGLAEQGFEAVARFSMVDDRDGSFALDLAGALRVLKDGTVVFNHKSKRGILVGDDLSYAHWMLGKDFPTNTKQALQKVLDQIEKNYRLKA